ncbi:unnamed protein product [Ambrosiozyma monospora]|uniref:Unnamed protein product n=1 Tax=Ambrosiozyma monospora TaxID=43982 RepID=A0ACB5SY39_AMBMO|nr:unnamed protein product [Ambrosiozyma monospora]
MPNVVVIGAGVVGLTSAYELLQAGHEVTVLAKQIPTDFQFATNYTSPFAGAQWASFAQAGDYDAQQLDMIGFYKFMQLAKTPETGVWNQEYVYYVTERQYKHVGSKVEWPWFLNMPGLNYKKFDKSQVPQGLGLEYGFSCDGVVISTTLYMVWLLNENLKTGRFKIQRKSITDLREAINLHHNGKADIIINATGLLARDLVTPEEAAKIHSVRGTTLLVESNAGKQYTVKDHIPEFPGEYLYAMSRQEGGTVIGGCFEYDAEDKTTIDPAQKQRYLERVKKYVPHLLNFKGELDIVREQVGFRPGRVGGPRIELDQKWTHDNGVALIHNYGHEGSGFLASWGSSARVLNATNDFLGFKSKL